MSDANTKESIASAYAVEAPMYDEKRSGSPAGALLSQHDVDLVNFMMKAPADATLLEIGAGTGRFTMPILDRGYTVIATDINGSLLNGLRAKVEQTGVAARCTIQEESVFELSFADESIDYVYSFHVLPRFLSLEDQVSAIQEIGRVLRPGGHFLFNFRNGKSPYNLLYRGHTASPTQINQALADAGMRVVDMRGKHLSSRRLYNAMPMFVNRTVSFVDRGLQKVLPGCAWDVFVLAQKT
ncbi:MAG: methyltransferase domain-containing protein [Aeoliella sp.]